MATKASGGNTVTPATPVDLQHTNQHQHKNTRDTASDHSHTTYKPNLHYNDYTPPLPAFLNLNVFLMTWFTGGLAIPITIGLATMRITYIPIYILAAYYAYRRLLPLRYWRLFHRFNVWIESQYKYFAEQKLILNTDAEKSIQRDSKQLLCWHPHGVVCMGWSMNGNSKQYFMDKKFHWLSADSLFMLPFIADYLTWCGGDGAGKTKMKALMKAGSNVGLLPGGFEEATIYMYGKHRIYIKQRSGFIKYALQYGYTIVPGYTFGEEYTFHTFTPLLNLRLKINEFKIPGVAFIGAWWCTLFPRWNTRLISVVGKPMELPHIPEPTSDDVNKWHEKYIAVIQQLFDENKEKYAMQGKDAVLEIW